MILRYETVGYLKRIIEREFRCFFFFLLIELFYQVFLRNSSDSCFPLSPKVHFVSILTTFEFMSAVTRNEDGLNLYLLKQESDKLDGFILVDDPTYGVLSPAGDVQSITTIVNRYLKGSLNKYTITLSVIDFDRRKLAIKNFTHSRTRPIQPIPSEPVYFGVWKQPLSITER